MICEKQAPNYSFESHKNYVRTSSAAVDGHERQSTVKRRHGQDGPIVEGRVGGLRCDAAIVSICRITDSDCKIVHKFARKMGLYRKRCDKDLLLTTSHRNNK